MFFSIDGIISVYTHFPLWLSRVNFVKSDAFNKSLDGPGSSSLILREWLVDLLVLSVEELLELPMQWNLQVQPHVRRLHRFWRYFIFVLRGYQVSCWLGRIFGGSCKGHRFGYLRFSSMCLLSNDLHFSNDVMEGIFPCKAFVLQIAKFSLCLFRELKLHDLAVKGNQSAHNFLYSLADWCCLVTNKILTECSVALRRHVYLGGLTIRVEPVFGSQELL